MNEIEQPSERDTFQDRIADLSPEKRALLLKRLRKNQVDTVETIRIQRREDQESYPMSFAQKRMWFLNQWEPENPFYNISSIINIKGPLDEHALIKSVKHIYKRHEILQVKFTVKNGEPIQIIDHDSDLEVFFDDLTLMEPAEKELFFQQAVREESKRGFDLTRCPLLRVGLIKNSDVDFKFFLTMHHIISDGWSIGIFIKEILYLYDQYQKDQFVELPELNIQYFDYAEWQRENLNESKIADELSFWKGELGTDEGILELPTDYTRPRIQSFNGAHLRFKIDDKLNSAIRNLCRETESSLFMFLLASFQVVLFRYSMQEDIRIGSPVINRNRNELQNIIGLFVNTVVFRADFSKDIPFLDFLNQTKEKVFGAFAHQDLPVEMLLDELNIKRDLSRTPLFQVMFAFQEAPLKSTEIPGLELRIVDFENNSSKFDITLFIEEGEEGLIAAFEYNVDLFKANTIQRMMNHFQNLLESIVNDRTKTTSLLNIVSEEEKRQILIDWNKTGSNYPHDRLLDDLFEEQVNSFPDKPALIFPRKNGSTSIYTYKELNNYVNRLSNFLRSSGVQPKQLIGIYMERSIEMIAATFAIIKCGASYLPLDLSYPPERIQFMMEDGNVSIVLTKVEFFDSLKFLQTGSLSNRDGTVVKIILLDGKEESLLIELQPDKTEKIQHSSDDLAYVMYTSGSTGQPKGVAIPQRAITRLVRDTNYIKINPGDRIAHASNTSFDAATFEIWGALLNGATLVGVDRDTALSPYAYSQLLKTQEVNHLFMTTALFNLFAQENPNAFSSVETLMFGGEQADVNAVKKILLSNPPKKLINVYGPTESTTFTTWYKIDSLDENAKSLPIGKPISNTVIYILDKNMLPVPVGVPGEIYIGGDGLAKEYLGQQELTNQKFKENSHLINLEEENNIIFRDKRIYKTGDLGRFLSDGNIEFIGRVDTQVKLRGLRIELGEIEKLIGEYPSISENVVLLREDTPGDKKLVGYIVPIKNTSIQVNDLKKFMKEKLPDFMIPSFFLMLDSLPITANGKVDRRALPIPDLKRPDLEKAFIPPQTIIEKYLAEKWQEVIGINQIGIYDDFFELGGDSLKAAILMNKVQEELGISTHVRAIFMAPTIAELSLYMNEYYPDIHEKLKGEIFTEPGSITDHKKDTGGIELKLESKEDTRITPEKVNQFKQIIIPLKPRPCELDSNQKNPPAVFVISPPRSGSTLLRTMMGGHPALFSPPELDLISFNTIRERKETFEGKFSFWLEGVERAVMELRNCDAIKAREIVNNYEKEGFTTQQFYREMQTWIDETSPGVHRMLVDKTPVYSLDLEILKRMEQDFENPFYIHLTRYPYASIYSFIEAKLDEVFFRYEHPFSQRELAELVWIVSHENILKFLAKIPGDRQIRIKFEDLVSQPREKMEDICNFLRIDYHPEMLKPYEGDRMTSGVRPGAQMVGDFKFYLRKEIDPKAADRWKKFHKEDFLSKMALDLAVNLDYGHILESTKESISEKSIAPITVIDRNGELPLSFAQQRLWFLDQWEPGSPYYNIPSALRINGNLNLLAVERSINEIIQRHEVLRTNFVNNDGKVNLIIKPKLDIKIPVLDYSLLEPGKKEIELKKLIDAEGKSPFDLLNGPLVRAKLIKINSNETVFLLTMHHIVSDGWSTGIWIRELAELYPAFSAGKPSPLDALKIQYIDYAAWQREWLKGDEIKRQLDYWKKKLQNSPDLTDLPIDFPRPPVQSLKGERLVFEIPTDIYVKLRLFCRQQGVTLFTSTLAIFRTLLYRYSRQDIINIGIPIANRRRSEIESLIGFFVNTLVLQIGVSAGSPFNSLLKDVQTTALEAYDHQDIPFERLVDELSPEREMSHTPLFQVMFTYQDVPITKIELPDLSLQQIQTDSGTSKFDMILTIVDRGDALKMSWEYNLDIFQPETIERMVGHYLELMKEVVGGGGEGGVGKMRLLTEREERQLLEEWNQTNHVIPEGVTIVSAFREQVKQTPKGIAVIAEQGGREEKISYEELDRRSNWVKRQLREEGVERGEIVGLMVERSVEMIIGLVGILKAGGAYVPLDSGYPDERIRHIMEEVEEWQGKGMVVVVEGETREVMKGKVRAEVRVGRGESEGEGREEVEAGDLAYVIYTSGSTGKPKGVMIEHRNAMNLWEGLRREIYGGKEGKGWRVSVNAPLMFDASVQQWLMILSGETLVVVPGEIRMDGEEMVKWVGEKEIDVLDCVPTQLKLMEEAGILKEGRGRRPKVVLPGGEAIDEEMWKKLSEVEGMAIYNMYGPTECTVDATASRVNGQRGGARIGKGLANVRAYVVDEGGELVPEGVIGELYIGGKGVGRGYLNREELTEERYQKIRYEREGRVYRTGDLVRWRGGELEYMGRRDNQVKVRGYRIELGEVEEVLKKMEGVREAVVMVKEEGKGEKQMVAYLEGEGELSVNEIRGYLKREIPEYMIPTGYVRVEKMPLTMSGKIDRKELEKREGGKLEWEREYEEPRSEKEKVIAKVWEEVMGIERVGVRDNFFELGGDSILTIQVIAKAKRAGLRITPRQMFEAQTVGELAGIAEEIGEEEGKGEEEQGEVRGEYPLTPIQRRFFEQEIEERWHWNQAMMLEVKGRLEEGKLREAVKELMKHHDGLRQRFRRDEGREWKGEIVGMEGWEGVVWVEEMGGEGKEEKRKEKVEEAQRSLNLEKGPLVRVVYFDHGEEENGRLFVVIHHLAVDGVSWRILLEDLNTIIYSQIKNQNYTLPLKTTSYKKWAENFGLYNSTLSLEHDEINYWITQPKWDETKFPIDFSEGLNDEESTEIIRTSLSAKETRYLLKDVNQAFGTDILDIFISALSMTYHESIGVSTMILDMEGHGRHFEVPGLDITRTVGWFTNIFPIAIEINNENDYGQVIKSIKEQLRRIPHYGNNFQAFKYYWAKNGLKINTPKVSFNYLGQIDTTENNTRIFRLVDEYIGTSHSHKAERSYLIDIILIIRGEQLYIDWIYSRNFFESNRIVNFAGVFIANLLKLISYCITPSISGYTPSDFPNVNLSEGEINNLIDEISQE